MIDNLTFDIGKRTWDIDGNGPWVSKTDVTQYKRCPYRVSLNYQEGIPYGDFLKPEMRQFFFASGIEFETEVVEEAIEEKELRLATSIKDIPSQDGLVEVRSLIRNHELGIAGLLDLLIVENGRLMPVEIKNHSYVTRLDKIELAFYWRLLEPIQKGRRGRGRKGYVILNSGEWMEVLLNDNDVEELNQLISQVRRTKLEGTQPRLVQECNHCVFKDQHLPLIRKHGDVSLVWGVGWERRGHLEELGIKTVEQLAEADTDTLLNQWRRSGRRAPGSTELRNMQAHAKAILTQEPQVVGHNLVPELGKALILDLEYFTGSTIFVTGILVVEDGKEVAIHQEFADSLDDEKARLTSFADLLESFATYSIVTWHGLGADMPVLEKAWSRLRLSEEVLEDIELRHIDLYDIVKKNFRFPIESLGLKEVASYYGFERAHSEMDSSMVPIKYLDYLDTSEPTLKQEVLDHNADDLRSLLLTWIRLRDLSVSSN